MSDWDFFGLFPVFSINVPMINYENLLKIIVFYVKIDQYKNFLERPNYTSMPTG